MAGRSTVSYGAVSQLNAEKGEGRTRYHVWIVLRRELVLRFGNLAFRFRNTLAYVF